MLSLRKFDFRLLLTAIFSFAFAQGILHFLARGEQKLTLILALPFICLFGIFTIVRPKTVFLLILLFRPLLDNLLNMTKSNVGGESIGLGAVLNLVIIALAFYLSITEGNPRFKNFIIKSWYIYLAFMLMAAFYSPFLSHGIRLFLNFLSFFCMFIIPFILIKSKDDLVFWSKIFMLSFILPVLAANVDLIKGGDFYQDAGMRIKGTFTHPNILGFYLVLGISFYFYNLKIKLVALSTKWRNLAILLMFNMFVLLIATKTRNAWIALFLVFFIYSILKDKKLLLILSICLPLSLFIPQVQKRIVTLVDKSQDDYNGMNSWEWRLDMWKKSLDMIYQKPIQGYGLTSYKPLSEEFSQGGRQMGAHNAYLETLFETGLLGLSSFFMLLLTPLFFFFRRMRFTTSQIFSQSWALVVAYLISYITICFADNLSYYLVFNWYVWFFVGLMYLVNRFEGQLQSKP